MVLGSRNGARGLSVELEEFGAYAYLNHFALMVAHLVLQVGFDVSGPSPVGQVGA
jgi:hypothetical protein